MVRQVTPLSGLPRSPEVPYLHVNRSLVNILGKQSSLLFSLTSNHKKEEIVVSANDFKFYLH